MTKTLDQGRAFVPGRLHAGRMVALLMLSGLCTSAWADGRLTGVVTQMDARDERAIAVQGASVRIEALGREVTTDRSGRFSLSGLPAGDYALQVRYLGLEPASQTVTIVDDRTATTDIALTRDVAELEPMTVVGEAAAINEALARQRAAENIRSIVNADAIGDFPDTNASEALQRLPGVSIERDQGEGRFVRIRGLGPELNSVTVNGAKLPSPESGTRAVALDVVPTELLESLEVSKTLTPNQDADSLGGSIDIKPLSAFDRPGRYHRILAVGSLDRHTDETSPKLALSGSDIFHLGGGHELGIAGGLSYEDRDFGSDNAEAQDNWDFDDGVGSLGEFEQRDYTLTRERTGFTLNLDYRTPNGHSYYARYLNTGFEDTETRLANVIAFAEEVDDGEGGTELDGTEIMAGETAPFAEIEREFKKRTETLEVQSFVLGGENEWNDWALSYQAALSKASEDTPFNIDGAVFEGEFEAVGFDDTRLPQPRSANDIHDPGEYALDEIELAETYTEDEDRSVRIDLSREFFLASFPATWTSGLKVSQREKTAAETVWVLEDFDDAGFSDAELSLAGFATGEVDYELGRFGPGISSSALDDLVRDGRIVLADYLDENESQVNDYSIDEDIQAAYTMLSLDIDSWHVLGGVRYEGTDFSGRGTRLEDGLGADGLVPVAVDNDYDHWLPSLHARYRASERLQFRAAWSNSLVRPSFEQARPGAILEEDDGEIEAEFGNPDLEATTAANFDLGVEWYIGRASALSAYAFYKSLDDFIYTTNLAGTPGFTSFGGATFDEAIIAQNGEEATVYGVELAYIQQFGGGFLLNANLTLSDSEAEIAGSDDGELLRRDIPLPSQSDTSANLSIGYEQPRFRVRLAANYKSSYLLEVTDITDDSLDIYQDDHTQIDLTGRFFITPDLQLEFQALNLNDEPLYAYTNRNRFNAQHEEYGPTYKLGLIFTNF